MLRCSAGFSTRVTQRDTLRFEGKSKVNNTHSLGFARDFRCGICCEIVAGDETEKKFVFAKVEVGLISFCLG
jgi:hypothetical protein